MTATTERSSVVEELSRTFHSNEFSIKDIGIGYSICFERGDFLWTESVSNDAIEELGVAENASIMAARLNDAYKHRNEDVRPIQSS